MVIEGRKFKNYMFEARPSAVRGLRLEVGGGHAECSSLKPKAKRSSNLQLITSDIRTKFYPPI